MLYQYRGIVAKCKKNEIEFGFTDYNHFRSVVNMPEHCPILGVKLFYGVGRNNEKAEIDRIDITKGYIPGNVAIISAKANQLKQDNTTETLSSLLRYIENNKGDK